MSCITVDAAHNVISRQGYPGGGHWIDQEIVVTEILEIIIIEIREALRRG